MDVTSSNVVYGVDSIFSFDVTVKNKIQQTLGTTDGTNPDPAGVRIFFQNGPTVTGGSGTITVPNASGSAAFTAANQLYFEYSGGTLGGDGVLTTGETSGAVNWHLKMPPSVTNFSFTVFVSAEVKNPNGYLTIGTDTTNVLVGGTRAVRGTVRSALGDSIGVVTSWTSADSTRATVNSSGVVTGVGAGLVTIRGNLHNLIDSTTIFVCNNFSSVGSTFTYTGQTGFSTCFPGGSSGAAEYTFIPINQQSAAAQSATVTGTSIQAVTGPPSPDLRVARTVLSTNGAFAPGGPALEIASDLPILEQDAEHFNTLLKTRSRVMKSTGAGNIRYNVTPNVVPSVGDLMTINTNSACSGSPSNRTGRVKSVSQHMIALEDTANPAGGFVTAQYDSIALEFDTLAWPVDSANFGAPTDLDNNGHVVAFFTRAVNELSPPSSSSVVLGFFASKDVFGTDDCSNSNGQATVGSEIFYMLTPDPTGAVNSNVRTVAFVRSNTTGTLGHEFQHMINGMRRGWVTGASFFEQGYLNEGLSHVAEELMFYQASGMNPKNNVGPGTNAVSGVQLNSKRVAAYNAYMSQNISRFRPWLQRPDTTGAFKNNANSLAVRGAIWAFLRYAVDRQSGSQQSFWFNMVNSNLEGTANIQNAIGGASPLNWQRDFTAALYDDDAVSGIATQYDYPSWNFRGLYALLFGSYSLTPKPLTNNTGMTLTYSAGGGAAYARFGVAQSTFANVTTLNGGPIVGPFAIVVTRTK